MNSIVSATAAIRPSTAGAVPATARLQRVLPDPQGQFRQADVGNKGYARQTEIERVDNKRAEAKRPELVISAEGAARAARDGAGAPASFAPASSGGGASAARIGADALTVPGAGVEAALPSAGVGANVRAGAASAAGATSGARPGLDRGPPPPPAVEEGVSATTGSGRPSVSVKQYESADSNRNGAVSATEQRSDALVKSTAQTTAQETTQSQAIKAALQSYQVVSGLK